MGFSDATLIDQVDHAFVLVKDINGSRPLMMRTSQGMSASMLTPDVCCAVPMMVKKKPPRPSRQVNGEARS